MTTNRPSGVAAPPEPFDLYDQGLQADVATLVDRRRVLQLMGLAGVGAFLAACAPGAISSATSSAAASAPSSTSAEACAPVIPEETAGPFPGDGTNGPDVLTESGVVRSDITTSFGASSGAAEGVPLTIRLLIQDEGNACEPLAGAAVYIWHCDREGRYSLYSQGAEDQNYLRGVQAAGDDGMVTFTSIFPACYSGRWPHIHFEVYPSLVRGIGRRQPDRDVPGGPAAGDLRGGLRGDGLRAERLEPAAGEPDLGRRVRRRRRGAPAGHDLGLGG